MGAGAAAGSAEFDSAHEDLELRVRSPVGAVCLEGTAGLDWTIGDVKAQLREQTGTPQAQQRLTLRKLKNSGTNHSTLADAEPLSAVLPPGCRTLTLDLSRRTDEQVTWLRRVRAQPNALKDAPDSIKNDYEVMYLAVQLSGSALQWASAEIQANRLVVMAAVQQLGGALVYAAEELRGDREFVLEAAAANVGAISCAAPELLEDKAFLLNVVERRVGTLRAMPAEVRSDREFVFEAVRRHGEALRCASAELRADREVVLEAVAQDGQALEHACDALRCDKEVVLTAIGQNALALEHAGALLVMDAEVVLVAVKKCPAALTHAALILRSDAEIVLAALRPVSRSDEEAEWLRSAIKFVEDMGTSPQEFEEQWRELLEAAAAARRTAAISSGRGEEKEDGIASPASPSWARDSPVGAMEFASPKLRDDPVFITQATQMNPDSLRFASARLRWRSDFLWNKEFMKAALAGDEDKAQEFAPAEPASESEESASLGGSSASARSGSGSSYAFGESASGGSEP